MKFSLLLTRDVQKVSSVELIKVPEELSVVQLGELNVSVEPVKGQLGSSARSPGVGTEPLRPPPSPSPARFT